MNRFDLFDFYRLLLMTAVGIYCTISLSIGIYHKIRVGRSLPHANLLWKYFIVQLLRVRLGDLRRPLIEIALLVATLILLYWLHIQVIVNV